jgi:hypothetical protein
VVSRIQNMLFTTECTRRQAPPGVKISPRSVGRDCRDPQTNRFRDGTVVAGAVPAIPRRRPRK